MKNKLTKKFFCKIHKEFKSYLNNFHSIDVVEVQSLMDLIHTKEYLLGQYYMKERDYESAEKVFIKIKSRLREDLITTHPYCFIIRRLGILKIYNRKLNEAIIEFQNIYEYSKELKDNWYYIYGIDLITTALKNLPLKALFLVNSFSNGKDEILRCGGDRQVMVDYYTNVIFINTVSIFCE
jgi:hypothetical protein